MKLGAGFHFYSEAVMSVTTEIIVKQQELPTILTTYSEPALCLSTLSALTETELVPLDAYR